MDYLYIHSYRASFQTHPYSVCFPITAFFFRFIVCEDQSKQLSTLTIRLICFLSTFCSFKIRVSVFFCLSNLYIR